MSKPICRALAPVLLLGFAASPALASYFPAGARYVQNAGSRAASAPAPDRKGKCHSRSERRSREDSPALPAWHELLARIF
jgi:hypothetical protein